MTQIKLSILFESGARVGPGKIALLESIRDTGSISAAARNMGMSYKRAWLLLDTINQAFTEPVVTAASGGARGGGAMLTAFGADLLRRYRRILDKATALAAKDAQGYGLREWTCASSSSGFCVGYGAPGSSRRRSLPAGPEWMSPTSAISSAADGIRHSQ
jgi:molybdate transport system regulatory protein